MGTHREQDHSMFGLIAILGFACIQASKHYKYSVPFLLMSAPSVYEVMILPLSW